MTSVRKITFIDAFKVAEIIKKAKIKSELSEFVQNKKMEKNANPEKIGMEAFILIIERAPDVQTEICALLAGFAGVERKDIENAEISEIVELFKDIAEKNDLKSFFQSLSGYLN